MVQKDLTPRRSALWSWLFLPIMAAAVIGIDQLVKHLIQTNLQLHEAVQPIPALAHLFHITYITNTGAAFGLFPDRSIAFVIIAIVVAVGILIYFRHVPDQEWLLKTSLAMQLGGAMGNLIDRLRLGYVVDFVDFRVWPVFNFADTFIVVGVILLAYRLLLHPDAWIEETGKARVADASSSEGS